MKRKKTKVLAIGAQKGGTGKTTAAGILAQAAVYRGRSVLAIDMDAQANLSFALAADTTGPGSSDFIEGATPADVIQRSAQGMDVIPATWNLATITSSRGSARRLQRALEPILSSYDIIIMDMPAQAAELQFNALQAATGLIIPLQADAFSLQALYQTIDTAQRIQASNSALRIMGVILTEPNQRTNLAREMKKNILEQAKAARVPFLGQIHYSIAVKEAAGFQQSIFDYAPNSRPAQDYLDIYDALEKH